ncbi:MAG: hypothetical protein QOH93_2181 [Chloroflexia bacterium]|jgi:hypothetical protein|nr:hypothetical protein [Chloroflexia bacterium]
MYVSGILVDRVLLKWYSAGGTPCPESRNTEEADS